SAIFVRRARFRAEHAYRNRIADAKDGLRSRTGEMRALRTNPNAFANQREQLCFVRRDALPLCQRGFRCTWRAITRLTNSLQRCDDKIESWHIHLSGLSKILRAATNSLMM